MGLGFLFCRMQPSAPQSPYDSVLQSTEHKIDSRLSHSFPRNPAGATHDCPASIRTLNGPLFWARCMLGFDLKPRSPSPSTVTGPGLLGAAIYGAVCWTRVRNAVSRTRRWMSLPANFLLIDGFPRPQLLAPWPWAAACPVLSLSIYAAAVCAIALDEA